MRSFIKPVREEKYFDKPNSKRLKIVSYVLMVAAPLIGLLRYILGLDLINSANLSKFNLKATFDLNLEFIVAGLIILMIAKAFDIGIRMQKEQELTV